MPQRRPLLSAARLGLGRPACFPSPGDLCYGSALCKLSGRFRAQVGVGRPGGNMSEDVTPSPGGAGFQIRTHNLVGGVVIAVIGFALLGYAFYVPNTMIARFLAGATGLIGVAVAVGLLPVPNPRDFYGGLA